MEITLCYNDDEEDVGKLSLSAMDMWADMCEFDDYIREIWKHGNGFDSADMAVDKIRERWLILWSKWQDIVT